MFFESGCFVSLSGNCETLSFADGDADDALAGVGGRWMGCRGVEERLAEEGEAGGCICAACVHVEASVGVESAVAEKADEIIDAAFALEEVTGE